MKRRLLCHLHIHSTFSDGTSLSKRSYKLMVRRPLTSSPSPIMSSTHRAPRSLEFHKEGKSIHDLNAYFPIPDNLAEWAKNQFDLLVLPGLEIYNLVEDDHILSIHPFLKLSYFFLLRKRERGNPKGYQGKKGGSLFLSRKSRRKEISQRKRVHGQ